MGNLCLQLLLLILVLCSLGSCHDALNGSSCIDAEREALLNFKTGVSDPSGRLSSWTGEDCCGWRGVSCSTKTKHVIRLDLHNPDFDNYFYTKNPAALGVKISSSLLDLKYLSYLDLSVNDFSTTQIPNFFGSLKNLRYLNLSFANFNGSIPQSFHKLSNLQYLDLNSFDLNPFRRAGFLESDLGWVYGLSSLKHLDLGGIDLSGAASYWLQAINTLPSLLELRLHACQLHNLLPLPLPSVNLTSLSVLDIAYNDFHSTMPQWLFNLSSLTQLDLSYNDFQGVIPDAFSELKALEQLYLWSNTAIGGKLPTSLGKLCNLKILDARWMNVTGDITDFIRSLTECSNNSLETLDLAANNLNGNLPNSIGLLKSLQSLGLAGNSFKGPIPDTIGNLSSLRVLDLRFSQMSGNIPQNLGKLSSLVDLDLSENQWEGIITESHLMNLSSLEYLSISIEFPEQNSLAFNISSAWVSPFKLRFISIESCKLGPEFPRWLKNQTELIVVRLHNAGISGTIPNWFVELNLQLDELNDVDLSSNHIEGPIPVWFSNVTRQLSLRDNLFFGPISPDIGIRMPNLSYLDISKNFLYGNIPMSLGNMRSLLKLLMSSNHLSGELPSSLGNSIYMRILNLGDNHLSGNLPTWIGESMPDLRALQLRNNALTGEIPSQLCRLSELHILDLSTNSLSGSIPHCIGNLTRLKVGYRGGPRLLDVTLQLVAKGSLLQYNSTLEFFNGIDLSNNDLSGGIPTSITSLIKLGTLNLSMNRLTGNIPPDIGNLRNLETLDFSVNHLSGPLPASMTALTFFSHLNLSFNSLSGNIPTSGQFQSLNDPSIYIGNAALCGSPLLTKCGKVTSSIGRKGKREDADQLQKLKEDGDELEKLKIFIVAGLGFILGFWGVCGSLIIKKRARDVYFDFLLRMKDKICEILKFN